MRAKVRRFRMKDYRKKENIKTLFGNQKEIDIGEDSESYYNAIADFLTTLGPDKIIGVQTPGAWYRWTPPVTDVWYWQE